MRARLLAGQQMRFALWRPASPIDAALLQIVETDAGRFDVLADQRRFGMLAPFGRRRIDDHAPREGAPAGSREEAVDIGFLDAVAGRVELALNGAPVVRTFGELRHQIDPGIAAIVVVFSGKLRPGQDAGKLLALGTRRLQPDLRQLLEIGALLPFRLRGVSVLFQQLAQRRRHLGAVPFWAGRANLDPTRANSFQRGPPSGEKFYPWEQPALRQAGCRNRTTSPPLRKVSR